MAGTPAWGQADYALPALGQIECAPTQRRARRGPEAN